MQSESANLTMREPHRHTVEEVVTSLRTDAQSGLSSVDVEQRLARDGRNELASTPPRPEWLKFLDQFTNVLVLLLIAAAAISAAIWLYERETALPYEAIAIFAIVILNALLGYV